MVKKKSTGVFHLDDTIYVVIVDNYSNFLKNTKVTTHVAQL